MERVAHVGEKCATHLELTKPLETLHNTGNIMVFRCGGECDLCIQSVFLQYFYILNLGKWDPIIIRATDL